ncbi:E4 URF [Mastadenovirus porcusquartum]|uniref:E4 URF n=1 Tax=Mastadenovirus porcusquartum TaxID=3241439 RepID=A0A7H0S561_9ADEN|nr:E4 URF [Porcine mastadenovirus B]QNQ79269.1 E4 URF [Porcine mastadenovirus B]
MVTALLASLPLWTLCYLPVCDNSWVEGRGVFPHLAGWRDLWSRPFSSTAPARRH